MRTEFIQRQKPKRLSPKRLAPANTAWASGQLADYTLPSLLATGTPGRQVSHPGRSARMPWYNLIPTICTSPLNLLPGLKPPRRRFHLRPFQSGSGPPPPPPVPTITGATISIDGSFRFAFTNTTGKHLHGPCHHKCGHPLTNWTVLGAVTEAPAASGQYHFVDPGAGTNLDERHYIVRWP